MIEIANFGMEIMEANNMSLLRNKGVIAALTYTFATSPVWSKSFFAIAGILTDSGQLNPDYLSTVMSYSPWLVLSDIACSLIMLYYFKKFRKFGVRRVLNPIINKVIE
jgi:hypothetical protein